MRLVPFLLAFALTAGCLGASDAATLATEEPTPETGGRSTADEPFDVEASPALTKESSPDSNASETLVMEETYSITVGVQGGLEPLNGGPTSRPQHSGMPEFTVPREATRFVLEARWEAGNPTGAQLQVFLQDQDKEDILRATGASPLVLETPPGARLPAGPYKVQLSTPSPAVFVEQEIHFTLTVVMPAAAPATA